MTAIFARADFHDGLTGLKDRHLLRNLAYVDGRWVAGDAGKGFDVTDPATGKSLAWVAAIDTDQVTAAIGGRQPRLPDMAGTAAAGARKDPAPLVRPDARPS